MKLNFYNDHISIMDLAIEEDTSYHTIYCNIRNHSDSDRYIVNFNGTMYINIKEYKKQYRLNSECWMRNTDELYWLLVELLKNDSGIARYMASKSNKYTSKSSWLMFLTQRLFLPIDEYGSSIKLSLTQHTEFTRLSTWYIYLKIKEGYFIDKPQ